MDQRDNAINDLSKLMDIHVVTDSSNQANVFTTSGTQLVGGPLASKINFSSPGSLTANSLYSTNASQNGVGSLTIQLPNGATYDMVANNTITSGQIAADLKLRDQTLVQAQTQVDQLAASMSTALSARDKAGTAVTGPPAGFSVNTSNMSAGQHHQPDRYEQRGTTPSSRSPSSTSPTLPRCRCRTAERQPKAGRRRSVRRHNADRVGATNAALGPGIVFSSYQLRR